MGKRTKINRRQVFCSLIFAVLLVAGQTYDTFAQSEPASFSAELVELFSIGYDESAPMEYVFGDIVGICTDSLGNIYVADRQTMTVRVFDRTGEYIRTIGSRGRGPGEFSHITSMHVDRKNRLVVADNLNSRFTWFRPEGDVIDTRMYDRDTIMWPRQIGQLESGTYVLLYREAGQTDLLHLVPSGPGPDRLEGPTASFGPLSMIPSSEDPFARQSSGFYPGRIWTVGSDTVVFAPGLYDGECFRFRRTASGWRIADTLSVWQPRRAAFTAVDNPAGYDGAITIHTGGKELSAVVNTKSVGIFVTDVGRTVHFLVARREDGGVFGVQVFDRSGQSLGLEVLERLEEVQGGIAPRRLDVTWMDDRGRFYLKDQREAPVLRVAELNFSESK